MHTCTWSIEQQAPVLASILGEKQVPQAALSGSGLMDYALQSSAGFSMKNKTLSACGMRSEDMGWGVLGNQPLVSRLSSPWSGKAGRQTPSCPGQALGVGTQQGPYTAFTTMDTLLRATQLCGTIKDL